MSTTTQTDSLPNCQPGRTARNAATLPSSGNPQLLPPEANGGSPNWNALKQITPLRQSPPYQRLLWIACGVLALSGLAWFSSYLAAVRIYQVDECQNLYMARILATGQSNEFFTNASLFLLGPLSWITKAATSSVQAYDQARLIFLAVFWLNILLLACLAAGGRLRSGRAVLACLAAATLAPLWDYGFEVRHDNVILTGVLLIWCLIRLGSPGLRSYFLVGAITVTMLFIAVKAVVYFIPLSLALLAFPPPRAMGSRLRLGLAWLAGLLMATILIRICYGTGGGWERYLAVFYGVSKYSARGGDPGSSFAPLWFTLGRLPAQAPLLLGLALAACFAVITDLARSRKRALSWGGALPEFLLFTAAFGALFVNPSAYPYNLLHLVPYAFLLAFRFVDGLWDDLWTPALKPLLLGMVLFVHLVPFGIATRRHLNWPNWRQTNLMRLAENLTDPLKDPVFDGIGMVITRTSIHDQWFLHGLNIQSFIDGSGPTLRQMLAARPASVFIPSYRTTWLPAEDHDFIHQHYVSFADDFWVLGKVLDPAGGTFEITHPGRYRISTLEGSDLAGTYPEGFKGMMTPEDKGTITGTIDGVPLSGHPLYLAGGTHRLETTGGSHPAVVWVGPQLERVHRVANSNHRTLFFNWY